ncbi:MAG: PPOX class F420-dependent oxidoreductase [Actinomycetes bacterium]
MAALPEKAKTLLDSPEFATIATLNPDGQPQLSIVWVERDGDDVLVSTILGRQKHRNLERDPKVTVLVCPKDSPYEYAEIRGTAAMSEEGGRELIDRLCTKYTGGERYAGDDGTDNVRVIVRITPTKVVIR